MTAIQTQMAANSHPPTENKTDVIDDGSLSATKNGRRPDVVKTQSRPVDDDDHSKSTTRRKVSFSPW